MNIFNPFGIFDFFETQVSKSEANFAKLVKDAEGFVVNEINAVDIAVVTSLKTSLGTIFTPALWSSFKTAAGQVAALLADQAFSVLTSQETLSVGVAAFLAGIEKIGVNSNLIPSHIAQQMVSAGTAMVGAGVGAAVSSADIAALKADIDNLISMQKLPDPVANTVSVATASVVAKVAAKAKAPVA